MNDYVSLLRGINVGGRMVKMADLKDCYESIGFSEVKTVLQSGNVTFTTNIYDSMALEEKLEEAVTKRFNYNAKIFVISVENMRLILRNYPYDASDETYQHYIIFIRPEMAEQLYEQGSNLKSDMDEITLGNNVIYWKVNKGSTTQSPFSKLLGKNVSSYLRN